jgi:hypothetical protein
MEKIPSHRTALALGEGTLKKFWRRQDEREEHGIESVTMRTPSCFEELVTLTAQGVRLTTKGKHVRLVCFVSTLFASLSCYHVLQGTRSMQRDPTAKRFLDDFAFIPNSTAFFGRAFGFL